jgi:hypothetical protein
MLGSINLVSKTFYEELKTKHITKFFYENPISSNMTIIERIAQLANNTSESNSENLTDGNRTKREDLSMKILLGSRAYYALEDVQKELKSKV